MPAPLYVETGEDPIPGTSLVRYLPGECRSPSVGNRDGAIILDSRVPPVVVEFVHSGAASYSVTVKWADILNQIF